MNPPLIPAQAQALANLHKELAALKDAEGKGGPALGALVLGIQADLLALYQTLLNIPVAK